MRTNRSSHSAFSNPQLFLAFVLCFAGAMLGVLAFAAPQAPATSSVQLKPLIKMPTAYGVSPSVRNLPTALPRTRTFVERELPPVKPAREVPPNFIDEVRQTALGALAMPTPGVSFEGLNQEEACGGCIPPDTTGAIGPTQYVQMTNSAFSVYSRTGNRLSGPTPINQLFQSFPANNVCRDTNNGDPVVVYDQLADRWLLSQFAFRFDANNNPIAPWDECIAISQGPDATGPYYIYDFHLSDTKFHDYPHIGLWPDAYYMATHEFLSPDFDYAGAAAIAFERDKMLQGQPAQMVIFDLGTLPAPYKTTYGGHLPSNLDGFNLPPAGAPNYFVEVDAMAESPDAVKIAALRLWKFHVDWTDPANSTFGVGLQPDAVIPVADFARPPCSLAGQRVYVSGCVPQLGDPSQLDPIGDRLMYRLVYRNFGDHEALVLNHTVVANAITGQMGPRWYEVRDPGGTPVILQQSTFGPTGATDALFRFVGSIGFDGAGNIAIGYSSSSAAQFPSINYAGRLANDPPNTLGQGEGLLQAGGGPQHGEAFAPQTGRWGDYTTLTIDPRDDCTFWYTNEYYPDPGQPLANWHTRVGNFKFEACTPRPTGTLTGVITEDGSGNPIFGAKIRAVGGAIDYSAVSFESGVYQFSPLPPGTYTVTASAVGYFSASAVVSITDGEVTTQDFALVRNLAEPTPTPPPTPLPLQKVNPPVLNDPGSTITTNTYQLTWSPAEVTSGLVNYVVEESTDYVAPLFDNAEGTAMPGDAASRWTQGDPLDPWVKSTAYFHSPVSSYYAGGVVDGFDTSLTLKNAITIPAELGSARVNFWSRFFNDPEDTGNVELSTDNGTTWITLLTLREGPMVPPADTRVQNHEVDVTPYKGTPIKLRFRFNTDPVTYFFIRTLGWWVDDILVDGATWTQIATTPPNTTSLNIPFKPNGHYYYRVRAVYAGGAFTTNSNVQDIIVNGPPNNPPVADLQATPTSGSAPLKVTFDATGSSDPDFNDTIDTYTFHFGDGSADVSGGSPVVEHTYNSGGTFTASVTVTDSRGAISQNNAEQIISVSGPEATPSPTPSATPSSSPTPSPGITPTPSPAATATPTATPIASATPTSTPTPSPGGTVTPTPSPSPSASASASATPTPTPTPSPSATPTATPANVQLMNISGRVLTQSGDNVGIGGFIITGSKSKRVMARAIGPSMKVNGQPVSGRLSDPTIELRDSNGSPALFNDNWRSNQEDEIIQTGLAPQDDKEAAVVKRLEPGGYTAIIRGAGGETGIGVIEFYDLSPNDPSELGNLSVRAQVGTHDNVLIDGLILRGGDPKRVLFRALGPSVKRDGDTIPGALMDPTLEVVDANGTTLRTNDDWEDAPNKSDIEDTGLAPEDEHESAILLSLSAGNYTSILRGANESTGIALSEAYKLSN